MLAGLLLRMVKNQELKLCKLEDFKETPYFIVQSNECRDVSKPCRATPFFLVGMHRFLSFLSIVRAGTSVMHFTHSSILLSILQLSP